MPIDLTIRKPHHGLVKILALRGLLKIGAWMFSVPMWVAGFAEACVREG